MKNTSIKNLIAVGTLAFMFVFSHSASAYVPGLWDPQPRVTNNPQFTTVVSSAYSTPVMNQSTTNTTTTTNTNTVQSTPKPVVATRTITRYVTVNRPATESTVVNTNNADQGQVTGSLYPNTSTNELTALSLNGSGGFMPSSIWQWFLVVLLILAIVIIFRMLVRKPEHHEIHTHAVTAH